MFVSGSIFQNFIQERAVQAGVGHFVLHTAHRVADNDRRAVMVIGFFIVAGIFQRHAGSFYGQVLHGIHLLGNLRRNTIFNGIKFERLGNKTADFGIRLVFGFVVRAVKKVIVPVGLGDFGNAVFTFLNVRPEFVFVQRSGHNGAYAYNGDRF